MKLRDYQIPAVNALARTKRGIVKAPAGSGKTIIGAAALDKWAKMRSKLAGRPMKIAWIAWSKEQCEQAMAAMGHFPSLEDSTLVDIFCYQAGRSIVGYDLVIFDECHHIPAETFRKIVNYYDGARWGLTATPDRADELAKDVFTLIGPIIYEVPRDVLVENNQLAHAIVKIHRPNERREHEDQINRMGEELFQSQWRRFGRFAQVGEQELRARAIWRFAQMIGLIQNVKRNQKIVDLANSHRIKGDSTLTIVSTIEHGKTLSALVPGSVVIYSKMGDKRRRDAMEGFKDGSIHTAFATSLADEGLDVPRANVLILAAGGRSNAKTEQRTGRVLRTFHDKAHGLIHDFWDHQHYFLLAQTKRRIALYEKLKYEIQQEALWA
jgi:superfamily II DNA or RNA helicase